MAKVKPLHETKPKETPKPANPQAKKPATTEHTVKLPQTSGYRVAVDHEDYEAIQYEFYVPRLIWELPSVRLFIKRIDSIVQGATLFGEPTGIWKGEREGTNIYRKIVKRDQFDPNNTRAALHSTIGRLMADLSASPEFAQEAVMFTETKINLTMSANLRVI
jgi:hypothetical protein